MTTVREQQKEGGLYSDEERPTQGSVHARLGHQEGTPVSRDGNRSVFIPTMVADELEISQHSDVHARLRKQGKAPKIVVARGSFGGRLGKHAIFKRLE